MKNKLSKFLLPLLLAPLMVGCGPKEEENPYDLDFNVNVSGETITLWNPFGSDISKILENLCDEFTRLTGVNVDVEDKSGYDTLRDAVNDSATSGSYANVIFGYPDHFAAYVKSDIILRLDYYFDNDVHNSTFEPDGVNFSKTDFYKNYMDENQAIEFDENGNPYTLGVPFNKSTEVLVYNKTFFDYFAKDDTLKNKIFVPQTYDEVESVGQNILDFLDQKGVYGKTLFSDGSVGTVPVDDNAKVVLDLTGIVKAEGASAGSKNSRFKPFSYDSQANLFITTVRQFGGSYTGINTSNLRGYLEFNSQETVNGLTRLKELYDKNIFGIPADWGEAKYGSNPFKACKTVMTLGSSAGVANSAPAGGKFEIAAAPVPYHYADKKYVISQGTNLALLDKGTKAERVASWQLLKFLSKYANGYFCLQTGYYPSCKYAELPLPGSTQSGMWKGYQENDDAGFIDYATWKNGAKSSWNPTDKIKSQTADVNIDYYINDQLAQKWTKFIDQPFAGSADIRDRVAYIPGFVFNNEKTPKKALDDMYVELSDYVRS